MQQCCQSGNLRVLRRIITKKTDAQVNKLLQQETVQLYLFKTIVHEYTLFTCISTTKKWQCLYILIEFVVFPTERFNLRLRWMWEEPTLALKREVASHWAVLEDNPGIGAARALVFDGPASEKIKIRKWKKLIWTSILIVYSWTPSIGRWQLYSDKQGQKQCLVKNYVLNFEKINFYTLTYAKNFNYHFFISFQFRIFTMQYQATHYFFSSSIRGSWYYSV